MWAGAAQEAVAVGQHFQGAGAADDLAALDLPADDADDELARFMPVCSAMPSFSASANSLGIGRRYRSSSRRPARPDAASGARSGRSARFGRGRRRRAGAAGGARAAAGAGTGGSRDRRRACGTGRLAAAARRSEGRGSGDPSTPLASGITDPQTEGVKVTGGGDRHRSDAAHRDAPPGNGFRGTVPPRPRKHVTRSEGSHRLPQSLSWAGQPDSPPFRTRIRFNLGPAWL